MIVENAYRPQKKGMQKLKLVVLDEGDAMVTDQNKDFATHCKERDKSDLLQILFLGFFRRPSSRSREALRQ